MSPSEYFSTHQGIFLTGLPLHSWFFFPWAPLVHCSHLCYSVAHDLVSSKHLSLSPEHGLERTSHESYICWKSDLLPFFQMYSDQDMLSEWMNAWMTTVWRIFYFTTSSGKLSSSWCGNILVWVWNLYFLYHGSSCKVRISETVES